MFKWVNGLLKLGKGQLYNYEQRLLAEIFELVESGTADILRRQLRTLERVDRGPLGQDANLRYAGKGDDLDTNLLADRFPFDWTVLARSWFSNEYSTSNLKCEISLTQGHIFTIDYSSPPGNFFQNEKLARVHARASEIRLGPLFLESSELKLPDLAEPSRPTWLELLVPSIWFRPPLDPLTLQRHLVQVDAALPQDYLSLLTFADGAHSDKCSIYSANEIRKLVLPIGNFYMIGELEAVGDVATGTVLLVKEESQAGEVYLLDMDDVEPTGPHRFLKAAVAFYFAGA